MNYRKKIYKCAREISKNIIYLLPRNVNNLQVAELAGPGEKCELQWNFLNESLKSTTAYFGDLIIQDPNVPVYTPSEFINLE